jgi:hypothetical protein
MPDFSGQAAAKTKPSSRAQARAVLTVLFTKSWVYPTLWDGDARFRRLARKKACALLSSKQ